MLLLKDTTNTLKKLTRDSLMSTRDLQMLIQTSKILLEMLKTLQAM